MAAVHSIPFLGITAFSDAPGEAVLIDDSAPLRNLVERARALEPLPFNAKMEAVRKLAMGAMRNAWEMMQISRSARKQFYETIIYKNRSLGIALEAQAGCCRYQAVLFLVLSAAAKLGDVHYVKTAPVNQNVSTCFNVVVHEGQPHYVSIFRDTLKDQKRSYVQGDEFFQKPHLYQRGSQFLSYHRKGNEITLHVQQDHHPNFDTTYLRHFQQGPGGLVPHELLLRLLDADYWNPVNI